MRRRERASFELSFQLKKGSDFSLTVIVLRSWLSEAEKPMRRANISQAFHGTKLDDTLRFQAH